MLYISRKDGAPKPRSASDRSTNNPRRKLKPFLPFAFALLLLGSLPARAGVTLPSIFADHMVLQRGKPVPIWGSAGPGEQVTVAFAGQSKSVHADPTGKWQVTLDPLPAAAQPTELVVHGSDSAVTLTDVLVGDVWLASGQSNMGFSLGSDVQAAEMLPKAQDPLLRFFRVTTTTAAEPQRDVKGKWEVANAENAKGFSAVAYYFAREIRADQKCPVAILQAPWGGTSIETWISLEGLRWEPPLGKPLDQWDQAVEQHRKVQADPQTIPAYEKALNQWQTEVEPAFNAAMKRYNDDKAAGKPVGEKPKPSVAEPDNPDPMGMPNPSKRPGTPTVNFNGMIAPLIPYALDGVIWYQGENNGSAGLAYRALFPRLIEDWRRQWKHGEAGRDGGFPFLFVQLPNNGPDITLVAQKGWPWLREAQAMALRVPETAMAVAIDVGDPKNVHPGSKQAVGHRLALAARKLAYGENVVASGPMYQGFEPGRDGTIRVRFDEIGGGLAIGQSPWYAPGVEPYPKDKLIGFFVAGADRKWIEADAKIDGASVVVGSPQVPQPVAVRYGWANSPRCNLYNTEGLPAAPFRTDDWPE